MRHGRVWAIAAGALAVMVLLIATVLIVRGQQPANRLSGHPSCGQAVNLGLNYDLAQRAALLGMAAAGLGTLGVLWIWIRLFTLETGVLLLVAAVLAAVAMVGAVIRNQRRLPGYVSAAIGAGIALLILGVGLSISIAPTCGAAGSSFHIDSWHQPWSAAYACGDGRLSFEFWPKR